MKPVVFAGPSVYGLDRAGLDINFRPPAASGDILAAVQAGAKVIGLIDGVYGDCAAVWHKEILFALSQGVVVLGAASMGALRAAECAPFGMTGVGEIFEAYRDGLRFSDGDVAVSHAPAGLGYRPLSVALVDAEATIADSAQVLDVTDTNSLLEAARSLHFSGRTLRSIVARAGFGERHLDILTTNAVSVKRRDAARLITMLTNCVSSSSTSHTWTFQNTVFFQALKQRSLNKDKSR